LFGFKVSFKGFYLLCQRERIESRFCFCSLMKVGVQNSADVCFEGFSRMWSFFKRCLNWCGVFFHVFFFFFPVLVVDNPLFRLLLEMEKEKNCGEYRDASRHVRICVLYAWNAKFDITLSRFHLESKDSVRDQAWKRYKTWQ
jgi:hypothetical protein